MRKIDELINDYLKGEDSGKASNGRLRIDGDKLYHYDTVIAYRRVFNLNFYYYELILNGEYYSATTAKVQNKLRQIDNGALSEPAIFYITEVLESDMMKYLAGEVTIEQLRSNSVWSSHPAMFRVEKCFKCEKDVRIFKPTNVWKKKTYVEYEFKMHCDCQEESTGTVVVHIPITTKKIDKINCCIVSQ